MSLNKLLATFFGVGLIPFAPGTMGSIAAIPVVLLFAYFGDIAYITLTFAFIIGSIFICQRYENEVKEHDLSHVVIDEVAGMLVAAALLPQVWWIYLAAFVIFRVLDILKPYPISHLDKNVSGGFGVVVDDLVAGLATNIILQVGLRYYYGQI